MILVQDVWVCGNLKAHPNPVILPRTSSQTNPLVEGLPTPLALLIAEYYQETQPFIKLHRMVDTAEMIARFLFIVAVCDLYQQLGDFPDTFKDQLTSRLSRPLFSDWGEMLSTVLEILAHPNHDCFIEELPLIWAQTWKPLIGTNLGNPKREILPLRNNIAHAGRLSDKAALELLSHHQPSFELAVEKLIFLSDYHLIAVGENGKQISLRGIPDPENWSLPEIIPSIEGLQSGRVYLLHKVNFVKLFPLHTYDVVMEWREDEGKFHCVDELPVPMLYLRFNPTRGLLEFTVLAQQAHFGQQGQNTMTLFLEMFNLPEWEKARRQREKAQGKIDSNSQEITRLGYDFSDLKMQFPDLNTFVGRKEQLRDVQHWILDHRETGGGLWINGKPGVGKSAFMAALWQRLSSDKKNPIDCLVTFFFRSGDMRCNTDHFFRSAILHLNQNFNLGVEINNLKPFQEQFLQTVEAMYRKQKKNTNSSSVLFLIDGLDELSTNYLEFIRFLMTNSHENMLWVFASRGEKPAQGNLETLWDTGNLPPLSSTDIRKLLFQELGRKVYELFDRDTMVSENDYRNPFIDQLLERSEGLPLYISLAVDDLKSNRLSFRDEFKLPISLQDYFDQLMSRLQVGDTPQILTDVLVLLCWAYEPLSEDTIAQILKPLYPVDCPGLLTKALRYGHIMLCRKRVRENMGWTLYHEAFRQYLETHNSFVNAYKRCFGLLIGWCAQWKKHNNPYALRYYASHLYYAKQKTKLYSLVEDETFSKLQSELIFSEPELPLQSVRLAIRSAIDSSDIVFIARYVVLHAQRNFKILQLSPYDRFQLNNLHFALDMVNLCKPEEQLQWYLLLCWALLDKGKIEDIVIVLI